MLTIDIQTARRFLLGRQGLWPGRRWRGLKGTEKAMRAIEYLQLDPLQILVRSQDITLHSRVIDYIPEQWEALTYRRRKFFDWGDWLAIRPMDELPYWRVIMQRDQVENPRLREIAREHAGAIAEMRTILHERDIMSNRDFEMSTRTRTQSYRGRKDSALALYYLWQTGEAMTRHRERFERVYSLTEHVAPAQWIHESSEEDTNRFLVLKEVAFGGLSRIARTSDSFRRGQPDRAAKKMLGTMLAEGELTEVKVEGWKQVHYALASDARILQDLAAGHSLRSGSRRPLHPSQLRGSPSGDTPHRPCTWPLSCTWLWTLWTGAPARQGSPSRSGACDMLDLSSCRPSESYAMRQMKFLILQENNRAAEQMMPKRAIVHEPGDKYTKCISSHPQRHTKDIELARKQHATYCKTLEELGIDVIRLPRDDVYPDSCFVEDNAVVFGRKALICRMAKESRRGEEVGVEIDNWIGVALLVLIDGALFAISQQGQRGQLAQSWLLVIVQITFLLPVVIIFAYRRINWRALGFGKSDWGTLGIGCGLLMASYAIILVHHTILVLLGIRTQGQEITQLFDALESPVWFFIVGAILAPLVEEIFFRGFLFQGFRARYGWVPALLLSSGIFGLAHLDPAALIPTFILGCLLAYLYHRSNSVWPGVIMHVLVNSLGLCSAYFVTQYPNLFPS